MNTKVNFCLQNGTSYTATNGIYYIDENIGPPFVSHGLVGSKSCICM